MLSPRRKTKSLLPGPYCPSCAEVDYLVRKIRVQGSKDLVQVLQCAKCGTLCGVIRVVKTE